MKKILLSVFAVTAASVQWAQALPIVSFTFGPGSTGGGEFYAATSDRGTFTTFCLEADEPLGIGVDYYYTVSQSAMYNGNGTIDPLSRPAAWLYLQFINGTLGNFGAFYAYSHSTWDADALQKAFWYLEGDSEGSNNFYAQLAVSQAGSRHVANNGFYPVAVMNVWANPDGTGALQDQLIRLPDGGSTLVMLGATCLGVAWIQRRKTPVQ